MQKYIQTHFEFYVNDNKKICSHCKINKDKSEFYPRPERPCGVRSRCKKCAEELLDKQAKRLRSKLYREKNLDFLNEKCREYRNKNKEKEKIRHKKYYDENKEKVLAYGKGYYEKHREKYCKMRKRWTEENKDRARATIAKARALNRKSRRAQVAHYAEVKRQCVPSWANHGEIALIYKEAKDRAAATGIKYNVDHIVPLISEWVCGLHWEENLQVLTEAENKSKANLWWPDMFEGIVRRRIKRLPPRPLQRVAS